MSFSFSVRVYWEDTDAGGVVYYANYLRFLERARTEWLRACGLHQEALQREAGVVMVIQHVELSYRAPARLDDLLRVETELSERRAASFAMRQRIFRIGAGEREQAAEELVVGSVRAACLDAASWRPRRFPPVLATILSRMDDA